MTFQLVFVHIISSSVWVAEGPSFEKELPTRLTISSLCSLTICSFSYFPFWFEGGIWVLIASVAGHCILVTFIPAHQKSKDTWKLTSTQFIFHFPGIFGTISGMKLPIPFLNNFKHYHTFTSVTQKA